jgi:predicted nucleic acid-binding Zn ribbon protein
MSFDNNRVVKFRRRKSAPQAVQSILAKALHKYGLDDDIARYQFILKWPQIVGEDIAKRTKPECIKNRTLVIRVSDSAWAQELSFQKNVILHRLKKYLAEGQVIEDVMFYVGG